MIIVIPVKYFTTGQPKKFQPRYFGAADWIEQKRLSSTPRLSPRMIDLGRDGRGRLWASPKAWRVD